MESAVPAELVAVAGRINNALRRLGSGWAVFVEAQRVAAHSYPDSLFPDAASALVEAERKAEFEREPEAATPASFAPTANSNHFESSYFLTFLYLPPAEETARAERYLYEGRDQTTGAVTSSPLTGGPWRSTNMPEPKIPSPRSARCRSLSMSPV